MDVVILWKPSLGILGVSDHQFVGGVPSMYSHTLVVAQQLQPGGL